jgi:protein-tyrosine sulfotransferase
MAVSAPAFTDNATSREGASSGAVFVLCGGRSGSTLLRFLLDAHPDLACPPETNVPALCGQLATVWSLIEGAPLSANRGDEPPEIPEAAIAGVRHTMDMMVGSYLERRGKKRYCDKSLGTARYVELLTRVYPDAKFICLYRHPMDVIASGLEACPWGLNGYGFDPYIAGTPGNAVLAMARFWADNVMAILRAEELFPDKCHRVRYEDMVSDPEAIAAGIFDFLGVPPAPGVSANCFGPDRERFGPADYKIWHTSEITDNSVGRGWTIPAGLMGPDMNAAVNDLAGKLHYLPVDDSWGTKEPPADLRVPANAQAPESAATDRQQPEPAAADGQEPGSATAGSHEPEAAAADGQQAEPAVAAGQEPGSAVAEPAAATDGVGGQQPDLAADRQAHTGEVDEQAAAASAGSLTGELLTARLGKLDERFSSRWAGCTNEAFTIIILPAAKASPPVRWRVDLAVRAVAAVNGDNDDTAWDVIGPAGVWDELLAGGLNLSVAMRRCQIRYLDAGDAPPAAGDTRIGMLADLLGLTSW